MRILQATLLGFFCSSIAFGQVTTMNVYQNNGVLLQVPVSAIDSVTLSTTPPPSMSIYQTGGSVSTIVLANIDSITYTVVGGGNVPSIGDIYQGGIVFYLGGSGVGLVAAEEDQGTYSWGCQGTNIVGADATIIGSGLQNTILIEDGCPEFGTAADICSNLTLGGYSDWYLPSYDELIAMLNGLGMLWTNAGWWSSTQYDSDQARVAGGNGCGSLAAQNRMYKGSGARVRAIRAFNY